MKRLGMVGQAWRGRAGLGAAGEARLGKAGFGMVGRGSLGAAGLGRFESVESAAYTRPVTDTAGTLKKGSWQAKFIDAFRDTSLVTEAARVCGKGRSTVYRERQRNEDFALAWAEAEEWVTEELEQEAKRRALEGSDTLLIFLLKAKRPLVYRESVKLDHGGKIGVQVEEGVNEAISDYLGDIQRLAERLGALADRGEADAPGRAEGEPLAASE
jgi:hypothetical protein